MIEFHGKPFLAYLIEMLRDDGFERVLLLLGYRAEVIQDYFGDGSQFGVAIEYSVSPAEDLTVERVRLAKDRIEDCFLLMYCDNYWPIQMDRMWEEFQAAGVPAMVTVYRNADGYTRSSVRVDDEGFVRTYDRSRTAAGLQGVEIGFAILTKPVLDLFPPGDALFEEAVYPPLTAKGQLKAFVTGHRYYSVGSHERLSMTDRFLARRPAVLLDRDGVLNKRPRRAEYVRSWSEFRWMEGAREALGMLTRAGYRLIVISNQAGVARGALTAADLEEIHGRMQRDVAECGGRIDGIYTCPHGWDEGCECRKPKPGMLFAAQRDHDLDLSRTLYIGDDERDAEAAAAAGCRFAYATGEGGLLEVTRTFLEGTKPTYLCAGQ